MINYSQNNQQAVLKHGKRTTKDTVATKGSREKGEGQKSTSN